MSQWGGAEHRNPSMAKELETRGGIWRSEYLSLFHFSLYHQGDIVISMGVPNPLPGEPSASAPEREEDIIDVSDLIGGDAIPISPDSIFALQSTTNSSMN